MAFTEKKLPVSRDHYFSFFATASSTNQTIQEDFNPGFPFELDKIRLKLSSVHASVVDFMVYVSGAEGSIYDQLLMSIAMNGIDSVTSFYNPTMKYHYNDTIHFSIIISAQNVYMIEVSGWAITSAPA